MIAPDQVHCYPKRDTHTTLLVGAPALRNVEMLYRMFGSCFGVYRRGPFALFAGINKPQNYIVKAILLMINPLKLYVCLQAKNPI